MVHHPYLSMLTCAIFLSVKVLINWLILPKMKNVTHHHTSIRVNYDTQVHNNFCCPKWSVQTGKMIMGLRASSNAYLLVSNHFSFTLWMLYCSILLLHMNHLSHSQVNQSPCVRADEFKLITPKVCLRHCQLVDRGLDADRAMYFSGPTGYLKKIVQQGQSKYSVDYSSLALVF